MSALNDVPTSDLVKELFARKDEFDLLAMFRDYDIEEEFEGRGLEKDCDCDDCPEPEDLPVTSREISDAYQSMRGDTPEAIRVVILALSGRIV